MQKQKQINPRMQYLETILDRPRLIWDRTPQNQSE